MESNQRTDVNIHPTKVAFDPVSHVPFATKLRFFRGLDDKEVGQILKRGRLLEYPRGATIFHEGTTGENLYVVFKGRVSIHSHSEFIAVCRQGDVFGELSALDHSVRSASAVAQEETIAFVIDHLQLHRMMGDGVVARFLLNIISEVHAVLRKTNAEVHRLRSELDRYTNNSASS